MSISRAFTVLADRDPDRLAVDDGHTRLTRADLEGRANALARRFRELGVTTDAFVTVAGDNRTATVVATVAAWKAGATPQPLSPWLPAAEQEAILRLVDPALVVSDEPMVGRRWLPLSAGDTEPPVHEAAPPPDRAAACWKAPTSSGSTGRPKIVLAAASAHVDPDAPVAEFVPHRATQLVAGPLAHAAPFVYAFRGLMTGHSLVLLPRFDENAWLDAIGRHRITWGMLVPAMMARIGALGPDRLARTDVSTLESVLHIGAHCPDHVKRAWIGWLGAHRIVEVYSGTESSGLTMVRGDDWLAHPGTVGRPTGGTAVRVVRPDGTGTPPGQIGRIEMTRPGPAPYRYLGDRPPPADTWHTLGDCGWLDDDGFLFLAGRVDDRIVSDGREIWPAAVESALERHPDVRSCLVVGRPDAVRGQAIHAVVDVGDSAATAPALAEWAATVLPPEHRPHQWTVVHEPLRGDTGKVRRREWQRRLIDENA